MSPLAIVCVYDKRATRMKRFLVSVGLNALVLIFAPSVIFAETADSNKIKTNCQVWEDSNGLVHAQNDDRLGIWACLGYLHGRDRAWQLDYFRRTVQGRKSEILGFQSLKQDFGMHLMQLYLRARKLYEQMSGELRQVYEIYSRGVNLGIKEALRQGVREFSYYDYTPEPWNPADSIALAILQSLHETKLSYENQVLEEERILKHGPTSEILFSSFGLPWYTTILKLGLDPYPISTDSAHRLPSSPRLPLSPIAPTADGILGAKSSTDHVRGNHSDRLAKFFKNYFLPSRQGIGSNSWVANAALSETGHALLANDPHLRIDHPPFWYLVHLSGPEFDWIGSTFPGIPVVLNGTNGFVSWGLTNSYLNVARISYLSKSELSSSPTQRFITSVSVRAGPIQISVPWIFRKTSNDWPIIPIEAPTGYKAVLRWSGFDLQPSDFLGFHELMFARTVDQADRALSHGGVPTWNLVFADRDGNIGYRAIGRIPKFEKKPPYGIGTDRLAQLGNGLAFPNIYSATEMPHLLNPARGYIATANNPQWNDDQSLDTNRNQVEPFRAFRIEELLSASPKHSIESFKKIQCDVQAVDARFLLPLLLNLVQSQNAQLSERLAKNILSSRPRPFAPVTEQKIARALEVLKLWDYQANLQCKACAIYRRWVDLIYEKGGLTASALYRKLSNNEAEQDMIITSLFESINELMGADGSLPNWGDIHKAPFVDLATGQSIGSPVSTAGDHESVSLGMSTYVNGQFIHEVGSSERLIIEMTSPPKVYSILAGPNTPTELRLAQKGNGKPPPLKSSWEEWAQCEYRTLAYPIIWSEVKTQSVEISD